jgi:hypothetical protein
MVSSAVVASNHAVLTCFTASSSRRHGDPAREIAMLSDREYAGMRLRQIGDAIWGLSYPAVSDAGPRITERVQVDRSLQKRLNLFRSICGFNRNAGALRTDYNCGPTEPLSIEVLTLRAISFWSAFLDTRHLLTVVHLVPISICFYNILKRTDVDFCFCRGGAMIVHGSLGSASLIARTSREHQGSRGTSDA